MTHLTLLGALTYLFPYQVYKAKRPEKGRSTGPSFSSVLSSVEGTKAFASYLVTEVSLENLYFYAAVSSWRREFDDFTDSEKTQRAAHIMKSYLLSYSVLEVNLSWSLRESLLAKLRNHEFSSSMFDEAAAEIHTLMENDSFPRFKRSQQFQAYMNDYVHVQRQNAPSL